MQHNDLLNESMWYTVITKIFRTYHSDKYQFLFSHFLGFSPLRITFPNLCSKTILLSADSQGILLGKGIPTQKEHHSQRTMAIPTALKRAPFNGTARDNCKCPLYIITPVDQKLRSHACSYLSFNQHEAPVPRSIATPRCTRC